jgi:hypothetical protein
VTDIKGGYDTTRGAHADHVRDAPAVNCVASHARDAADCALLLDMLGLTAAAPVAALIPKIERLRSAGESSA